MNRVQTALLAVIAAALIALVLRPAGDAPALAERPCIIVVNDQPRYTEDERSAYNWSQPVPRREAYQPERITPPSC